VCAQLPVIDEHVQHMLEHDVIEPAASPWCSNVVMVRVKFKFQMGQGAYFIAL